MKTYYDWPKIMTNKTDPELGLIVKSRHQISEEEFLAAEQEMINRGLLEKDEKEGNRKILKRVAPDLCFLIASLHEEGKSNENIINELKEKKLNKKTTQRVLDEFIKEKIKSNKNFKISLFICLPLAIILIILCVKFSFVPGVIFSPIIFVPIRIASKSSPNQFKKHVIQYYDEGA